MNVTIDCTAAPQLARWVTVLVDDGWKLIDHTADAIRAQKQLGQSSYPVKNATTWVLTLEEDAADDVALRVTIDVPAFAEGPYARTRVYDEFRDLTALAGDIEAEQSLHIDILDEVRG